MAHPSLLNKCGVNLALLLSSFLQLSLEAFHPISSMLKVLATMHHPGIRSLRFALFVSVLRVPLRSTFILSNYATQFLFSKKLIPLSPLLIAVPLSIQNRESSCGRTEGVCPNPLIEKRMKQARVWGSWSVYSLYLPPIHGRAESHPLTSLLPIAHLSHFTPSCVQSVAIMVTDVPAVLYVVITITIKNSKCFFLSPDSFYRSEFFFLALNKEKKESQFMLLVTRRSLYVG